MWFLLAQAVAFVHVVWIAAFLFGPAVAWARPPWRWAHLVLLWATTLGWRFYCPLTVFENLLRAQYDPSAPYGGGFIEHLFSLEGKGPDVGKLLALGVVVWTVLWTALYVGRWRRERGR